MARREKKSLLGKFGAAEHEKYVNFSLPRQSSEVTFRETIQVLIKIFGEQSSLFNTRWQCLNLTKKDCEDCTTFASPVNRYCERFQLNEITPDMFKCLIFIQDQPHRLKKKFVQGYKTKFKQDQKKKKKKKTLQRLPEECQPILNLRADTVKSEERDISNIHKIKSKPQGKKNKPFFKINPCYECGGLHLFKYCPFKHKKWHTCWREGHKFSHCRLGGGNYPKNPKNRYSAQLNKQQLKKYKENT